MNLVLVGRDPWFTEPRRSLADALRRRGHLVRERGGMPPALEGESLVVIGAHDHGPPPRGKTLAIWTEQDGSSVNSFSNTKIVKESYGTLLDIRASAVPPERHIPAWVEDTGVVPDWKTPRPLPAIFYGTMTARRQEILTSVTKQAGDVCLPTRPIWGDEKRAAIQSALVALVIHAYDGPSFEGWRFAEAARDGALILSETPSDSTPWEVRKEYGTASSKDLGKILRVILDHPDATIASRERAFERFKACATAEHAAIKVESCLAA